MKQKPTCSEVDAVKFSICLHGLDYAVLICPTANNVISGRLCSGLCLDTTYLCDLLNR